MNFKKKIAKILNLKTHSTQLIPIQNYWAYKLSIRDVSLILEANELKSLGRWFRLRKLKSFLIEYDEMFNGTMDKTLNNDIFRQKLYTKHLKLNAIYTSLLYCNGENARAEFKNMFGKEFETTEDLQRVVNENNRILTKIRILTPDQSGDNREGVSFNKLVALVEASKGVTINRSMMMFEFKELVDIELKKWQI